MSFEEELLKEINEFRTNPKEYSKKIEKQISYFKGKTLMIPGTNTGMKTQEGAEAYKEAVDFLSKAEPVNALVPSKGLAKISKEYLEEIVKVDPNEIDKVNLDEILQKYGTFEGSMNRELDMGNETPEQIVISIIVSDGDATRGHRDCLLSPEFNKIGMAYGKHPTYRFCSVILFCTKFNNNVDPDDYGFYDTNVPIETKKEEKEEEGQTLKPKKVVLKQKPKEEPKQEPVKENNEDEEEQRDDIVSEKRKIKYVEKNGKRTKITKITRTLKDGSKEVETIEKVLKEGEKDSDDDDD